jgi:hypothetical protein
MKHPKLSMSANVDSSSVESIDTISPEDDTIEFNLKARLFAEIREAATSTTAHGLPHILEAKSRTLKLMWLTLTLCSVGFCAFIIIRSIMGYVQFDVSSAIRQSPQENITFPLISICNVNRFSTKAAFEFMREYYLETYGLNFSNYDEFYWNYDVNDDGGWLAYISHAPWFNDTLRKSFGYSLDEMLIKCEFNSKPCNLSWFEWFYHPLYSNCYKFNSGELNGGI